MGNLDEGKNQFKAFLNFLMTNNIVAVGLGGLLFVLLVL